MSAGSFKGSVGIVTLPGNFNYGNRLQAFATAAIYRSLGYSADVLVPKDDPWSLRAKATVKRALGRAAPTIESGMSEARLEAFMRFNRSTGIVDVACATRGLRNKYDWFSVGSDQVWNPIYIVGRESWYFLTFARPEQRIALAPSIGLDELTPKQARMVSKGVSGFSRISVRERRGAELIWGCARRGAEIVCDPTIAIAEEEWRGMSDDRLTPREPYVFAYLLGRGCEEAGAVLDELTSRRPLPVVRLSDREGPGEPPAGPSEFLSLIGRASHVVTNSFHAAALSCVMRTPLTIVRRSGATSMFGRLESLVHMLGVEEKVYGSPGFDLRRSGDYDGVSDAIDRERARLFGYLEECLDG